MYLDPSLVSLKKYRRFRPLQNAYFLGGLRYGIRYLEVILALGSLFGSCSTLFAQHCFGTAWCF